MELNDKLKALNEDLFLRIKDFINKEGIELKSIKFEDFYTTIEYYDNKEWLDIGIIRICNRRYISD